MAKRLCGRIGASSSFWRKHYYYRNVREERELKVELRYLRWNPVKRGLMKNPADWPWTGFRHYALGEAGVLSEVEGACPERSRRGEIESEWTAVDPETRTQGGPSRIFLGPV